MCACNDTPVLHLKNGAYWATPLSYVASAMLATGHSDFLEQILEEAIIDFKSHGQRSAEHIQILCCYSVALS